MARFSRITVGFKFACGLILLNSLGLLFVGAFVLLVQPEGIPLAFGVALLVSGLAMGRGVGFFIQHDLKGIRSYRIGALIFSIAFTIPFLSVFSDSALKSWIFAGLVFVFAIAMFLLLEAIVRERIDGYQ